MMTDLQARQQALVNALTRRDDAVPGLKPLPGVEGGVARGLRAYRVNAQGLAAKVLAAHCPRVRETFADEAEFDAMAWAFWRAAPPERGDLGGWGAGLADFLAAQAGMDPELCERARLDWAHHEAECAADARLDVDSLDLLADSDPARLMLRLRPGTALVGPVLVWRKGWWATSQALAAGDRALMQALLDGRCLAPALEMALAADAAFDFGTWLQTALRESWLLGALTIEKD